MQTVGEWARDEFGGVVLGDKRRAVRLVEVAEGLARSPGMSIPRALSLWSKAKAAYRLLSSDEVTHSAILSPHVQRTRDLVCKSGGEWLFIEDWSQLDYTGRQAEGLGQIGNEAGRGLLAHTSLALRVKEWNDNVPRVEPAGLVGQKMWTRDPENMKQHKMESWRDRLKRERESQHWGEAVNQIGEKPADVRWTLVADRECDLSDIWSGARLGEGVDFVVRIFRKRRLENGALLEQAIDEGKMLGHMTLELRARPGKAARTAKLEIRSTCVQLRDSPRSVQVVHARELQPPTPEDAIDWKIATTWPADTFEQARRILRAYGTRWLIEEYHKAWKTGAGVERAQLHDATRLEALAAILALVALRLLSAKFTTSQPLEPSSREEKDIISILEAEYGKPKTGQWTERELIRTIARFGGFLARKSDGEPGWQSIWRGWNRLTERLEGFQLAKRCG